MGFSFVLRKIGSPIFKLVSSSTQKLVLPLGKASSSCMYYSYCYHYMSSETYCDNRTVSVIAHSKRRLYAAWGALIGVARGVSVAVVLRKSHRSSSLIRGNVINGTQRIRYLEL